MDMMRIGVLSDTHGHLARTELAARVFRRLEVAAVIHCGDIGSPEVVELLAEWPSHFVFGNVDDWHELRAAIRRLGMTCHERFGTLELEGKKIAILHGDDAERFDATIRSSRWDLVCHGHTHVAEVYVHGSTKILNPGAVYRSARPSVAIVDLPELRIAPVAI